MTSAFRSACRVVREGGAPGLPLVSAAVDRTAAVSRAVCDLAAGKQIDVRIVCDISSAAVALGVRRGPDLILTPGDLLVALVDAVFDLDLSA